MKQLLFFVFLISFSAFGQSFNTVDSKIKTYPKLLTAEVLAKKIDTDFSTDLEKVRAIYSWLAFNIKYDLEELYNPSKPKSYSFKYSSEEERKQKINAIKNVIVIETLESRKAVCEGYAQVFSKLCTLLSIENEIIKGHVRNSFKEIGKPKQNSNHAWNAIKLNGTWKYFDATWGAGYKINGKWERNFNDYYFNIPKKKLFLTHFPEEKLWQLRVKRFSKEDFYNQPIYNYVFLDTNLELVLPTTGVLIKDKEGNVSIKIKNLKPNQKIYFGFKGYRQIKKAIVNTQNGLSIIKVVAPKNSKAVYLFMDTKAILEFVIK